MVQHGNLILHEEHEIVSVQCGDMAIEHYNQIIYQFIFSNKSILQIGKNRATLKTPKTEFNVNMPAAGERKMLCVFFHIILYLA